MNTHELQRAYSVEWVEEWTQLTSRWNRDTRKERRWEMMKVLVASLLPVYNLTEVRCAQALDFH